MWLGVADNGFDLAVLASLPVFLHLTKKKGEQRPPARSIVNVQGRCACCVGRPLRFAKRAKAVLQSIDARESEFRRGRMKAPKLRS